MDEWKVLYHYTSLDAFVNIVKSGEFRLFDITKSNDPLEGKYLLDAIKGTCSMFIFSENGLTKNQHRVARHALFKFEQEVYNHNRLKDFYAATSFCVPHHELMMLRSYADNGRGVALGVAVTTLENLAKKISNLDFKKVEYFSSADIEEMAIDFWHSTFSNLDSNKIDDDEAVLSIVESIRKEYEKGFFIKSKPNEDEEEYRLLYHYKDLFDLHLPTIPIDIPEEVDFISTRDDIKAYYRILVGNDEKDLLHFDYIFLGPLCKATVSEMQVFLQKNGISVNGISNISNIQMR